MLGDGPRSGMPSLGRAYPESTRTALRALPRTMRLFSFFCSLLGVALLSSGCGAVTAAVSASSPTHDAPVPAGEPRATVQVTVDLEPASSCEEAFDLALYARPGVDVIEWRMGSSSCAERKVSIRYLPSRISRDEVLARAKSAARKMEIVTP